jgi:small subunit ribosomal protein S6
MNTYEMLAIFKPSGDGDGLDGPVRTLETMIRQAKGKMLRADKIGRKRLAYDIGRQKEGLFAALAFQLEPSAVLELRRQFHLIEDLIRFTLVRNELFDPAKPVQVTPVTPRDANERPERPRFERGGRFGGRGDRPMGDRPPRFERDGERPGGFGPDRGGDFRGPRPGAQPGAHPHPELA